MGASAVITGPLGRWLRPALALYQGQLSLARWQWHSRAQSFVGWAEAWGAVFPGTGRHGCRHRDISRSRQEGGPWPPPPASPSAQHPLAHGLSFFFMAASCPSSPFFFAPSSLGLQHLFPFIAQSIPQVFILLFPPSVSEPSSRENNLNLL